MSNLIRPYHRAPGLFDAMLSDFFNDPFFSGRTLTGFGPESPGLAGFRVDIRENEEAYTVYAELPGVDKDRVSLDLKEGVLTIDVAQNEKDERENEGFIHRERRCVSMRRGLYLKDAAAEGANASLENGILTVTVPKAVRHPKESRIQIH